MPLNKETKPNQTMIINNTQNNSKCRLCGDRGETVNHIVSENSKLAQKKCKCKNYWIGNVNHLELWKRQKLDNSAKWYMHKPESVLQNEMHKNLKNFLMQSNHLIQARKPELVLLTRRKELILERILRFQWTIE